MNWEAIGAIGEIIGASAVVLTLGYLALQINHNTKAAKSDARQRVLDRFSDAGRTLVSSGVLHVVTAAQIDFEDLSNDDKSSYTAMMTVFANNLINAIRLREERTLDEETFKYISNAFVMAIRTTGGANWWKSARLLFPKSFVAHVNGEIVNATEIADSVAVLPANNDR